MYIQDPEVAHFFGINSSPDVGKIRAFSREFVHYPDSDKEGVMLLGKERTLYEYSLRQVYDVYRTINQESMMILCTGLSKAKGSGMRSWINTQNNISNFNLNICLRVPISLSENLWDLQERISVAIVSILDEVSLGGTVGIIYPFHYTLNGGKVAGHLVQKMNLDSNTDFLRIGIGVNTAPIAPELPQNDDLAKYLFTKSTSIKMFSYQWIDLAMRLGEAILANVIGSSKHDEYIRYLNVKSGDKITVYQDDGSISLHNILFSDTLKTIDPSGKIITRLHAMVGSNHHIRAN